MNQKELECLRIEENFKDTLENEIAEQSNEKKKIIIKDIKYIGDITGKSTSELSNKLFMVEREIIEEDARGKRKTTEQIMYYLGERCIGIDFKLDEPIYSKELEEKEPEKKEQIKELLEKTPKTEIEKNSLEKLQEKEKEEVQNEILSEKETEQIKVNGIQKVDLNKLVDGKETLGSRLDLKEYNSLYVIYSDKVDDITKGEKKINTTYSLVGMKSDGEAKVLTNEEFEIDGSVGNSGNRQQTKIKANSTATRDNRDTTVLRRKSNGVAIGCENDMGNVNLYYYEKTKEENENIGIQVETSKTPVIPLQTREIMNRNRGIYNKDNVQDEIKEHTDEGCKPKEQKDFDGDESTSTHTHEDEDRKVEIKSNSEIILEQYIQEIYNSENENGEQNIKEIFTEKEVRDKFIRELNSNKELSIDQIKDNVESEMNEDAERLRSHKR